MKITAVYLLLAIIAVTASVYVSRSDQNATENKKIGENLFEQYAPEEITTIELIQVDQETKSPERLTLQKGRSNVWSIKEKFDYHAGNTSMITAIADSLLDRKIYATPSDEQSDWEEYGVVDPASEQSQSPDGYGTRLELKNYQDNTVASLIIGKQVQDNASQRFVRIPGQPLIYMIDYDTRLLSTEFAQWVDPNLMDLYFPGMRAVGNELTSIEIHNYRISMPESDQGEANNTTAATPQKQPIYNAIFELANTRWQLVSAEIIGKEGKLAPLSDDQKAKFSPALLNELGRYIVLLPFDDVQQIGKSVAELLATVPIGPAEATKLKELKRLGFYFDASEENGQSIESSNGHLLVRTKQGIQYRILLGNLKSNTDIQSGIQHWMLVRAEIDQSQFAAIAEPEEGASEEKLAEYKSNVKAREDKLKNATDAVTEANKQLTQWLYSIDQKFVDRLRPDLEALFPGLER